MISKADPIAASLVYAIGVPMVLGLIALEVVLCSVKGWRYYTRSALSAASACYRAI